MAQLEGGAVALDMFSGFDGQVITAQSNLIQVSYGGSWVGNYWGSFQYSGSTLVGGTVNVYEEVISGQRIVAVTGVSLSAVTVANYVANGDTLGLLNLVFGGSDSLAGSSEGDFLVGLNGNDIIEGRGGNDDINGNMGNDAVVGGPGNDWVRGGQGDDTVIGSEGDDPHVNGNIGSDLVLGGVGNDTLYGGQGYDTLDGGDGNDLLSGDLGPDVLYGRAGADRFYIHANTQTDTVGDFNGAEGDRIAIPAGQSYSLSTFGGFVVIAAAGSEISLYGITPAQFDSGWVVYI